MDILQASLHWIPDQIITINQQLKSSQQKGPVEESTPKNIKSKLDDLQKNVDEGFD